MAEANPLPLPEKNKNYEITAAIDFGTTYSCYAFSFNSGPRQGEIFLNRNWGANVGTETFKAPTCVLTGENGEFLSFGYEALKQYNTLLAEDRERGSYHLFKNFKMTLHISKSVYGDMTIKAVDGHERKAKDIVEMVLRFFKSEMLKAIRAEDPGFDDMNVQWVLSVPAIWSVRSKDFMRKAAYEAGLIKEKQSKQLVLSLEPEAAALFCKKLETNLFKYGPQQISMDGKTEPKFDFKALRRFILIDAGGGTVDITAYEIEVTGELRNIHFATGGPWGGMEVDENFANTMKNVFERAFVENFMKEHPYDWLLFLTQFEKEKMSLRKGEIMRLPIPLPLFMAYSQKTGKGISEIEESLKQHCTGASIESYSLIIPYGEAKKFFETPINHIISHLDSLIELDNLKNLDYMILVGGFGQCELLQDAIWNNFHQRIKVLFPLSSQMAIIKGSVMYGQQPEQVKSRVARKTYGDGWNAEFIKGKHDISKRIENELGIRCNKSFRIYIRKGESVEVGDVKTFISVPGDSSQTKVFKMLYGTDKTDPMYTDEEGVEKIGQIDIEMPDTTLGIKRKIETRVSFGGTELLIEIRELTREDSQPVRITLDFLSDINP